MLRRHRHRPGRRGLIRTPFLGVEGLENRLVMAAGIGYDAASRTLTIVGSDGNDSAEVRQQGSNVVVSLNSAAGQFSRSVNVARVSRVVFSGLGGNDSFTNRTAIASQADGGAGDDVLSGGQGRDELMGSDGNDQLFGGAGNDMLDAGAGNDAAWGGAGNDLMMGGIGNDQLNGDAGTDSMWGGLGNDQLLGGAGNDSLQAGAGNDRLDGGLGSDRLVGGEGLDREVDTLDRFADGDVDGDGYDNDYDRMDILLGVGSELAYADDATVAPIITAVSGEIRGLLNLAAADAGFRVRVQREQFGDRVTGVWRYLTPDKIQVWGRWAYSTTNPAEVKAFVQYQYTGPYSGDPADYANPANYVISEESRLYAGFLGGPSTFVGWLPDEPAGFSYSVPDDQATGFPVPIEALKAALSSLPNFTSTDNSLQGNFSTVPGLPGIQPVIGLVRTIDQVTRAARVRPVPQA
jgi:hypothetical protein